MDLMIPPGERLEGRCEIPQHSRVAHREQNPHAVH